jgi:uncharacterized protein YbaP (TraB family)
MRRIVLLFLLVACSEQAQKNPPTPPPVEVNGPFLWKATSRAGTAYLFGTIHIPADAVLALPAIVIGALENSNIVLTELELNAEALAKVMQATMLPRGQTLSDLIPKDRYDRISRVIPLGGMKRKKVWAVMTDLLQLHGGRYFLSGRLAMDLVIPKIAKKWGLETGALETPEEQLAVFDNMPIEDQITMLEKLVEIVEKDRKQKTNFLDGMIEVYLEGDLEKMMNFAMSFSGEQTDAERALTKALLDDRNVRMADRLVARINKRPGETWFVAVGAAHHWGPTGMPAQLRAAGFTVTRVPELNSARRKPVPQSAD